MNHGYHYLSFYYILSSLGVPSLACVFLVFNLLTYLSTSLASHTLFMPPPCLEFTLNLTNILSSSSFIIPISLQSFNFFYHQIFFLFTPLSFFFFYSSTFISSLWKSIPFYLFHLMLYPQIPTSPLSLNHRLPFSLHPVLLSYTRSKGSSYIILALSLSSFCH